MKAFIITLAVAVVVAVGGFFIFNKPDNKPGVNSNSQSQNTGSTPGQTPTKDPSQAGQSTITYDGSQFSPAELTVKSGDSITIKNTSSNDLELDSDPHPIHTDDPDLNVGTVAPGQSQTFTVTKTGTFGFHNHLNSSNKGTITVE